MKAARRLWARGWGARGSGEAYFSFLGPEALALFKVSAVSFSPTTPPRTDFPDVAAASGSVSPHTGTPQSQEHPSSSLPPPPD